MLNQYFFKDNVIQVHDINVSHFPIVHQAIRTKGANIFTIDSKVCNQSIQIKNQLIIFLIDS